MHVRKQHLAGLANVVWWALLCFILVTPAVGTVLVFFAEAPRPLISSAINAVFALGFNLLLVVSMRCYSLRTGCLVFLTASYLIHLTWEGGWLVVRSQLADARESAWAYLWWAYIDAGDSRYATPSSDLVVMEALSVLNGLIGSVALVAYYTVGGRAGAASSASSKSARNAEKKAHQWPLLVFLCSASIHMYSATLYYATEGIEGFSHVSSSRFDFWMAFVLANLPWLYMPVAVFTWVLREVESR